MIKWEKVTTSETFLSGNVYDIELEENHYFPANSIITHNCRLRNEISENTFNYTLGNVGIMTGSKHVITLNVNRFIQNSVEEYKDHNDNFDLKNKEDYEKFLKFLHHKLWNQTKKLHKYHISVHNIFKDFFLENKMLPVYDAGFISLDKQFSTIGVNGLVEGAEFLGLSASNNQEYIDFCAKFLHVIFKANKDSAKKANMKFNTEFVPAENLGVKNALWDKEDGYVVSRPCYNSYFYVVEDDNTNIIDKFILHGKAINQYLDGGSALHNNLAEHLTKEQYLQQFAMAIQTGTNYFTYNVKNTKCLDCKTIDKRTYIACPKCGSANVTWLTRVIGYLKEINSFSEERRFEESNRFYHEEAK